MLHAAANLDVASARGRHADWLHATEPRFISEEACSAGEGCMTIHQARHPILLKPCLDPLPAAPSLGDEDPLRGIGLPVESSKPADVAKPERQKLPVPLDLLIPPHKTVVVVTGPNTGTVS